MPVRPVVRLPHPVLRHRAAAADVDAMARHSLAIDLVDTMRVSPGCVGLAAPQIGVAMRAFCLDVSEHRKARSHHGLLVMFDPVVVAVGPYEFGREGCMSVPELTGDVPRATEIVVRGFDPDGRELVIEADAFEARALQHELDHLDGLLFLDRVESPDGVFARKVYR